MSAIATLHPVELCDASDDELLDELARRHRPGQRVQTTSAALAHFHSLRQLDHECLAVLPLNTQLVPLAAPFLRHGELDQVVVTYRTIFRQALLVNAAGIILAHNHPSGDPQPSSADHAFTNGLVAAGRLLNVQVLDHIVLTGHRHFSFKEARLIELAAIPDTALR